MNAKPTLPDITPLVNQYLADDQDGGTLSRLFVDRQVKDKDIESCMERAKKASDIEALSIASVLFNMSKTQRKKVAGMYVKVATDR